MRMKRREERGERREERGERGEGRGERKREGRRRKKERNRGGDREERDTKHSCSCANDSQDHNRLPVPRSKQALSRRLQVPAHTKKNLLNGETLWSVFQDGSNETSKKKTQACELVHHRRCSKWPPLARTHAKRL